MANYKIARINSDISKYISDIISNESRDELLKSITITGTQVTNDLSYCKVYFTSILDMDKKRLEKEVNDASSFIRGRLSEKIDIRRTPELKFIYDESTIYGKKIEDIIKSIEG